MTKLARKVGVFHPGTQHSWQTARALHELGQLGWYATSIFYQPERWPYKITNYLPSSLRNKALTEFKRFYHPELSLDALRTFGLHEWVHRGLARAGYRQAAERVRIRGNRAFAKAVQKLMRVEPVSAVWGYDTSSAEVFRYAKNAGVNTVLDKTIGDWRVYNKIMQDVYNEYNEYFFNSNFKISNEVIDIQDLEYSLADKILVGSPFCGSTISSPIARPDVEKKIEVVPYCFDNIFFKRAPSRIRPAGNPVRFLFLGQAGPRKGIHLLLKAFSRIPQSAATLTIVGQLQIPNEVFSRFSERVTLHSTVARSGVASFLRDCDCLVFPSYFEGSGITVYEALACGRGVIQSKNMNLDAIPHAGLALEKLDEQTLYEALMQVIDRPDILNEWRANAPKLAEQFTFAHYRDSISNCLFNLL